MIDNLLSREQIKKSNDENEAKWVRIAVTAKRKLTRNQEYTGVPTPQRPGGRGSIGVSPTSTGRVPVTGRSRIGLTPQ